VLNRKAAMTYSASWFPPARVMIEEPKSRILVVDDHEFGTNDCRGWISHSIFRKLRQRHVEELTEREIRKRIARLKALRASDETFCLSEKEEEALREQAKKAARAKALQSNRLYQFRLSFEKTRPKGSFKVMSDEVAEALEADIILPKSSIKPK